MPAANSDDRLVILNGERGLCSCLQQRRVQPGVLPVGATILGVDRAVEGIMICSGVS